MLKKVRKENVLDLHQKLMGFILGWDQTILHPSWNPFSSFCVILLTNQPANTQTWGENHNPLGGDNKAEDDKMID